MNGRFAAFRLPFIAVALFVLWLITFPASAQEGTSPTTIPNDKQAIDEAWHLAQASGIYHYRSLVAQTSFPAPSVTNAGREPTQSAFGVEGSVDLPAETLEMTLWRDASFDPARGVAMRIEGDTAYGRVGAGEWEEVQDVSEVFAPGGDPLGFLAGVKNVTLVGEEERDLGQGDLTLRYTRYTFEVDGTAFGDYMRERVAEQMRSDGELPPGVSLETPQVYRDMAGTGEIWLDDKGLPARLTLNLEVPDYKSDSRTTATITNDYWGYDTTRIAQGTAPFWQNPTAWVSRTLPQSDSDWIRTTANSTLLVLFLGVSVLSLRVWRLKQFYAAVVGAVILSMLLSPLMQSGQVYAFAESISFQEAEQAAETATQAEEANAISEAQAEYQPDWNPQRDPLAPVPPALQAALDNLEALESRQNAPVRQTTTTTDTDGDGLSDADEEVWGGCPSSVSTSENCEGVTNPTDTDGDGFSDGIEVNQLATLPARADSDGDGISDWLEVKGFTYNGTQWYLNPNEEDSNYDGFADGYECAVWSSISTTYNANGVCPDTDKDGSPDLFDTDNDEDGVVDDADLSPSQNGGLVYSDASPLELKLNNLQTNQPSILTLQFRPTAGNITHQALVLDWPSNDDAGHIQRQLDTTFATTTDPNSLSTDILAGNGDVRLTPLLEITMPYTTGHYANLPVNSTYAGSNRTVGVGVDEWLDADALDLYGVDLQDVDDTSGDLVAYLPLGTDTSNQGDEAVAFNARMLYYPTQGSNGVASWGEAHQFRLIWLVQMLQDECINPSDNPDTCAKQESLEVVHIYQDEWTLSGLQVSEEHGTDVAVLYENPVVDNNLNLDDHLWDVSWNLSTTFMEGRDCDTLVNEVCQSNGSRDVTIANMATAVDGWSSGTNYVAVQTYSGQYEHQHEALSEVAEDMQSILTTTFAAYTTRTAPTLLLTSEHTARTVNLADAAASRSGTVVTLNFNPSNVLTVTSVGMNWQPYHYVNGEWTTYDIEDYLALLDTQVQNDAFFQPEDSSSTAAEEVEGKRLWAQYYYTILYQGLTALAEVNDIVTWAPSDGSEDIDESTYQATTLDVSLTGLTFIGGYYGFIALEALKSAYAGTSVSQTIWSGMLRDGSTYSFGKSALLGTGLMAGIFITAVVGIGLYVAGYLTGNGTLVEIGRWVLTITAIVSPTIWLITMMVQIVQAVQAGIAAGVSLANMGLAVLSVSKGFPVFPAVMLAVTIAISLIFFLYALSSIDLKNNPASAYALAAYTLAGIYVQLLLFAIGLIPVIGQIIVVLFLITEAILMILGEQTMTAWLTEKIAGWLFDYDTFLKLDDPDRLEFTPAGSELVDEELGFDVTNAMTYSLDVTNTVEADDYKNKHWAPDPTDPTAWQAIKYSTFRYFLKSDDDDEHSGLGLYQMEGEWEKLSNHLGRTEQTATGRFEFSAVGSGINRNFGGAMYLVEAYAATYVLCIKLPTAYLTYGFFDEVCTWHSYKGSNPVNVGEYVEYDILPETVSEFADVQTWNYRGSIAFPQQKDQDGDGLLSQAQGGVDLNDLTHDQDGDGLSDTYEASYGTPLNDADGDKDGLNDAEELEALTDPFNVDSDNDGLSDYTELVEGWIYAFPNASGTYIKTRVWSDPLHSDADNDTLSDLEEFVFGTHPRVATDPSFIKDLIRFDNLSVEEDSTLQLLTRFKEGQGSTTFADLSGNDNGSTCDLNGETCPTAGVTGRYGVALQFDGTDYLDTGSSVLELGKSDFTVAAWVKTTGTKVAIVTKSDGDGIWERGEKSFYIDSGGRPTFVGFGNEYIRTNTTVNDGTWHHVTAVWDYSGSGTAGTARMYVDGVDVTNGTTNYRATNNDGATHTFRIARSNQNANEAQNHFNGTLDEVAAFSSALTADEVMALAAGRYNPSDLVVVPDTTLTYQAVVTNTHPTQGSDGLLSADTHYIAPEVTDPSLLLHFEPEEQVWEVANGTGESTTATCLGDGSCPTFGAEGSIGNGVAFDGALDVMELPYLGEAQTEHTLAFWLKVDSLPATGEQAVILETSRSGNGALTIYVNDAGRLIFDIEGSVGQQLSQCDPAPNCTYEPWTGDHISDFSYSGSNLGTWQHFLWWQLGSETRLYRNAGEYWDSLLNYTTLPALLVGPGTLGNNSTGTAGLDGTLDEFVFYNNDTIPRTTSLQSYKPHEIIRNGGYWIGTEINNISDHIPSFLLQFNEDAIFDPTPSEFYNSIGDELICASEATCPTFTSAGYDGYGINFDGSNDYLPYTDSHGEEWAAVTMWVKADSLPASGQTATLLSTDATGDVLQLYINSAGNFVAKRDTRLHTSVAVLPIRVWTQVHIRYYRWRDGGNWRYDSDFYINNVFDSRSNYYSSSSLPNEGTHIGPGRIGNNIAGTSPFDGTIDEIGVDNMINTDFDEGDAPEPGFVNSINEGRTTFCENTTACPTVGATGAVSQAITFDGVDDYLSIQDTDFARGDYTVALWFKSSATTQQALFAATDAGGHGVLLELQPNGTMRYLHRFPSGGSGGVQLFSPTAYNDGQWHHATAVYEDHVLRLFMDGVQVATTQNGAETGATTLLDVALGRLTITNASRYFAGSLDELVMLPAAIDAEGIAILMADQYPGMTVAEDFLPFTAPALTSTEVSGTMRVESDTPTSRHRFEEEVEAALQLSAQITIPIIDDNAADLMHFIPFEDVPGSTLFENVVQANEMTCSGDHCPTAGLRGKVDRAAFFDGVDDYLETTASADVVTVAAWVNADRGTIVDTVKGTGQDYGGLRLDVNRFWLIFEQSSQFYYYNLPITLPENEWAHVVGTYDSATKIASVYVNGALQTSQTLTATGNDLDTRNPRIGLSKQGLDGLNGYLDDLRMYDIPLSAAQVQSLYLESAAVLRYEFDEESDATTFADSSIYGYTGVPSLKACVPFVLGAVTVNSTTTPGRDLYAYFNGARFMQETAVTAGTVYTPERTWTVCGGETVEVGFITNGVATSVGIYTINALNVATVAAGEEAQGVLATLQSGGDTITLSGFLAPEPTYQPNPAPGTDGQIGNTALFDGVGAIEIEDATSINSLTNDFTVMGWINPNQLNTTQQIFAAGQDDSTNGFSFGIANDKLRFTRLGGSNYNGTTSLDANVWQQVAIVFDSSNDAHFYIDGLLQNTVAGATAVTVNGDDPWYIGATTNSAGALTQQFAGQIDELSVYSRSLTAEEIISIYLRELRWYRARATDYISVDDDLPTMELRTQAGSYYKDGYIQVAVTGADVGSDVELVDFGVKAPGASTFTWTNAPVCADISRFGSAWCPAFTSTGEGAYTLQFRAVDSVGNEAFSQEYTIYVDDSAPTVSSTYNGEWQELVASPDVKLSWTVELSGTVSDPTLTGGIPGSGVYSGTASVALIDGAGVTLSDDPQIATIENGVWSLDYQIDGIEPVGKYTVWVSAEDHVGNSVTDDVGVIQLDGRDSEAELDYWSVPNVITDTTVLQGTVNEQPSWAGVVAQFHFEESSGTDFYDGSYYEQHGECTDTSCPTGTTGQFGRALAFDGNDAVIVTDVLTDGSPIDLDTLSMSTWVYPTTAAGANGRTLVMKGAGTGANTNYALALAPNGTTLRFSANDATCTATMTVQSVSSLPLNQWSHVTASYDGSTARLYLNGKEDATAAWTGGLCQTNEPIRLGNGGAGAFVGRLDELRLFDRALSAEEIYALAQSIHSGVAEVEIALAPVDLENEEVDLDSLTWTPATVTSPDSSLSAWEYLVPNNTPEDFYTVYVRGRDAFENESGLSGVWRGAIDKEAPRITFTASTYGSGATQYTDYQFEIEDILLDPTSIEQICGTQGIQYHYHTGTEVPKGATGSCRTQGAPNPTASVTACDFVEHCATVTVSTPTTRTDASVIFVPAVAETYYGLDPIEVSGMVVSDDGVQYLDVTVDGQTIYTQTWASGVPNATWTTNWTPPTEGMYELEATLTTYASTLVSDPFTNTVLVQAPALTLTKNVTPTTELQLGDALTYTLMLTNSGSLTATDVVVSDVLPEGISGVSLSETITLTPGSVISFTIPATVTGQLSPTITNTAQFTHTWQQESADVSIELCDVALVSNANDSGVGSLRQAISGACDPAVIYFTDDFTIYLNSTLTLTKDIVLDGNGHTVTLSGDSGNDGDRDVRVLAIPAGVDVTLNQINVEEGLSNDGGGIQNNGTLTIVDSTIHDNRTRDGNTTSGGIHNLGTLTLTRVTMSENSAGLRGGAIYNNGVLTITESIFDDNEVRPPYGLQRGGAIFNDGTISIDATRFSENSATQGGAIYSELHGVVTLTNSTLYNQSSNLGGGIYNIGAFTVENSTFVGNSATNTTWGGGGIYNRGTLTVGNSTFSGNSTGHEGGAIYNYLNATLTLNNSVLANSTGNSDCFDFGDSSSVITIASLIETTSGDCNGTLSGDPLLGTLSDYGGSHATLPLLPGSPAIDAGDDLICTTTDQRGIARVGTCDMGAFESRGFVITQAGGDEQSTPIETTFADTLAVTVTANIATEPVAGGVVTVTGPVSGAGLAQGYNATIDSTGLASTSVTANSLVGSYSVTAGTNGSDDVSTFNLANTCFGSAYSVTTANDDGAGSLRRGINNLCDGGTITFTADSTIYLSSTLTVEKSLTIDGNGFDVTISGDSGNDGSPNVRLFTINSGSTVTLSHLTLEDGKAGTGGAGGAILNQGELVLESVTVRDNSAEKGGAIANLASASLTVRNSTIYNNSGTVEGAALFSFAPITLTNSTISGNSGTNVIFNASLLTVTNSTIANNTGNGVVNNGTLTLGNTIVTGSSGVDCSGTGTVSTGDHTLIEDGSCGAPVTGNPLLAPLGNYGGDTLTHALLPGSPALNVGGSCGTTDQRGETRVGSCDIGAFESQGFTLAYLSGTEQRTSINTNFPNTLRVQVSANAANEPVGTGGGVQFVGPSAGAGITPALSVATTDNSGIATLTATANAITGTYTVSVTVAGAAEVIPFTLTNYNCAALSVENANDSGDGSLRKAIEEACPGATISFTNDQTIYLNSPLSINKTLTIDGSTQDVVISGDSNNDGTRNVQPFRIQSSGVVTITHLSIISGTTSNTGGGAILNQGDLRVYNSYFQNNHSTTGSGGGAIYSTNRLAVLNSTFYSNTAEIGGGISVEGQGTVVNSTFSANNVVREGGGVYNRATLTFTNNTVAYNDAFIGTGIYNRSGGVLAWNNNILANNGGELEMQCFGSGANSGGNNLVSSPFTTCGGTQSTTLYLSPLGEYGGDTPTHALQLGSSAIDVGNSSYCTSSPVNGLDQRGEPRSDSCDVGAFEARFTLVMTGGDSQSTTINTLFANPLEVTISGTNNAPVGTNGTITFTGPAEGAGISGNPGDSPDNNGVASVNVSANGVTGSYVVTATTTGADAPTLFALTNTGFVVLEDATFGVDEDATNGTVLGTIPTDNQTGNPITYQVVSGNEDGVFALNSDDGVITVADNSTLDYETTTDYLLSVSAGDGALTDTATIAISVNNLFADVSIDKNASASGAPAGNPLTYTLTFENEGREVSSGVVITDLMPAEVTVVDIEVAGDAGVVITPDGTDPYVWTVSDLAPGAGGVITITTEVNGDATGDEIINHAEISTSDEEDDTDNNEATVNTTLCLVESIVTSDENSGDGSLRDTLTAVCDGGMINFDTDMTVYLEEYMSIEKSVTVDGNGHNVTISGDAGVRGDPSDNISVLDVYSESPITVTLRGLTIADGQGVEGGAGVTVSPSAIVTIEETLVTNHQGTGVVNSGTLILRNSTVSNNAAYDAGGVYNGYEATMTILNSTISGNRAEENAGGIKNWYGTLTITHSTIISNTANSNGDEYGSGGGIYSGGNSASVTVSNSIVAGNLPVDGIDPQILHDNDCYADPDIDGNPTPLIVDGGYNLVGVDGGCATDSGTTLTVSRADLINTVLEPLGNYGGETFTHALRNASPAIDIIPFALCEGTTDQRGQPRGAGVAQGGTHCDIGAYESFSTDEIAGDVSCDAVMNTVDGLFTLQFGAGTRGTDYTCGLDGVSLHLPSCDTNEDGTCNNEDGSLMLQCDVGLDTSFCPATPFGGITRLATMTRGGAVVTVGSGTITLEQSAVTIPIILDAPSEAMGAINVIVTYDESVIDVADCSAAVDSAFDEGYCNAGTSGEVRFNGVVQDGVTGEDMVVGTITFQRGPPVITDTIIPLPILIQTFADSNGGTLPISGVAGQLTVRAIPLAVTLAEFTATPQSSEVMVTWETASEVDNLGFNLLRATTPNVNSAIQLNDELILSQSPGGGQGALYEWEDNEVIDGVTYWYWLESVDAQGNVIRFGPVTATFGSPTAIELRALSVAPNTPLVGMVIMALMLGVLGILRLRRHQP
jgi:uncharacterized repeat protein (TIGR01451 family)